jgi:hypothetical protein
LSASDFTNLRDNIMKHDLVAAPNEDLSELFNTTSGFVVKFTARGERAFRAAPELRSLVDLFDSVVRPDTNAFGR